MLPLFFRLFILPYQPPLRKGAVKIPVISACIAPLERSRADFAVQHTHFCGKIRKMAGILAVSNN